MSDRSPVAGTNLIGSVSVRVPVDSVDIDTLRAALKDMPTTDQLKRQDSLGLGWITTRPLVAYVGGHGDVLLVTPLGILNADPRAGEPGTIDLSVRGKSVGEAVFR